MESESRYYYDSYAMVEFVKVNERYKPFFENHAGVTTKMNLMEVYFGLSRILGRSAATDSINYFSRYLVDFELEDITGAMDLRVQLTTKKQLNISYADALGYYLAKKLQIPFLTGDFAFRGLDGVKFVK